MDVTVARYPQPTAEERAAWPPAVAVVADTWEGYVEPADRSWILFIPTAGDPVLFTGRDPETGAVPALP